MNYTLNSCVRSLAIINLFLVLLFPNFLSGAETAKKAPNNQALQVNGFIESCDDTGIVVKVHHGKIETKEVKLAVSAETHFGAKNELKSSDFKAGNHVKITYSKGADGTLTAKEVLAIISHPVTTK